MTMSAPSVLTVLNELLTRESNSLAPRLFESTVFVSRLSVADHQAAQRIAEANARHGSALAALITDLGGVPEPRTGDLLSADLHFQEMHYVLPRLVANHEALIESYRLAAQRVTGEPSAVRLIAAILAKHERELSALRGLMDKPKAKAS